MVKCQSCPLAAANGRIPEDARKLVFNLVRIGDSITERQAGFSISGIQLAVVLLECAV